MSKKKTTLAGTQKKAAIIFAALIVVLALTLVFVNYLVSINTFEDSDGTVYKIKPNNGSFALYDEDGNILKQTMERNVLYYVTQIGTLVSIGDDGKASVYSAPGEPLYTVISEELNSIQITQTNGDEKRAFKFERDSSGKIKIKGFDGVAYDAEKFANLSSACRIPRYRLELKPDVVKKYGYEEYGLDSPQATVTVTSTTGTSHSFAVGNKVVSGDGYYVRLTDSSDKGSVYIINSYLMEDWPMAENFIMPVEYYVTPILHYGMTDQNYMFVYNFKVSEFSYPDDGTPVGKLLIALSYWDYSERENTEYQTQAYIINDESLDGYAPASDAVYKTMNSFLEMPAPTVKKLGATQAARAEYGLDKPIKSLYYESERTEDGQKYYFKHYLYFSDITENGTHYVVADTHVAETKDGKYENLGMSDYIVEIHRSWLEFLDWETLDWIERDYFQINIGIINYMEFDLPDGSTYRFEIDQIDENTVRAYTIKNGKRVAIDTNNFKTLYLNMLGGKLFGSANMTTQREEEIVSDPNRARLTWRFKTTTGTERTHSYYFLETNKDYITINGDGGFYVLSSSIQKVAEDVVKVYNGERITADSPYTNIDEK